MDLAQKHIVFFDVPSLSTNETLRSHSCSEELAERLVEDWHKARRQALGWRLCGHVTAASALRRRVVAVHRATLEAQAAGGQQRRHVHHVVGVGAIIAIANRRLEEQQRAINVAKAQFLPDEYKQQK